jgi:hypothetical protein
MVSEAPAYYIRSEMHEKTPEEGLLVGGGIITEEERGGTSYNETMERGFIRIEEKPA